MLRSAAALLCVAIVPMSVAQAASPADLVRVAKQAKLSDIDQRRKACGDERTVAAWIKAAFAPSSKPAVWSGGRCILTFKERPRDIGTGWCAHAHITPKRGGRASTIEIYFEPPKAGKLGKAFAFRSLLRTKHGPDYGRDSVAFETNWGEAYVAKYDPSDAGCD